MKRSNNLSQEEAKRQRIAIVIMWFFVLPILLMFIAFFVMAFFDEAGTPTLANFRFLLHSMELRAQTTIKPMYPALMNSIVFTVAVTLCEVTISMLAGYALSRLTFRGRQTIQTGLLVLRMFPNLLLLIAVLYILIELKLVNTLRGVIFVAIAFRIPGSTFIIKNFFDDIPRDIENSTLVDGCSRISGFFQVIIHLVKPGIASIAVFSFLSAWSNFILFNTLLFNNKTPVMATYVRALTRSEQMIASYNVIAAMGIVYMIPVIVFFLISQKQLMQGTIGGGKGIA